MNLVFSFFEFSAVLALFQNERGVNAELQAGAHFPRNTKHNFLLIAVQWPVTVHTLAL